MSVASLGFIGLGSIGAPMAGRLVGADYTVVGFDAAGTRERLPEGASEAGSVEEVASRARTIFLSLPDGDASKAVCSVIAHATGSEVQTVVDLSTIGLPAARECARILKEAEIAYADAPVSGGVPGAREGSLAVMVGADAATFEKIRPLLGPIGKNCFHMGEKPGDGQAMKLLNNFLSATALAATSEAVLSGERLGLDIEQMIEVINASTGRNTASTGKFPKSIIPRTYDYGFASMLMSKDVELYLENAKISGTPHGIGEVVARTWRDVVWNHPESDCTYLYKYLQDT